jgi:hypothetical protein
MLTGSVVVDLRINDFLDEKAANAAAAKASDLSVLAAQIVSAELGECIISKPEVSSSVSDEEAMAETTAALELQLTSLTKSLGELLKRAETIRPATEKTVNIPSTPMRALTKALGEVIKHSESVPPSRRPLSSPRRDGEAEASDELSEKENETTPERSNPDRFLEQRIIHEVSKVAPPVGPRRWINALFRRNPAKSAAALETPSNFFDPRNMAAAEAAALDRNRDAWKYRSIETSECVICQLPLNPRESSTLCPHACHPACVRDLKAFGVVHPCPQCSPPEQRLDGTERRVEQATRRFFLVDRRVHRGLQSWRALRPAYQRDVDEVVAVWRAAAEEKNHFASRFMLGQAFEHGCGVPQSDDEAEFWYKSILSDCK